LSSSYNTANGEDDGGNNGDETGENVDDIGNGVILSF
jgi:hypothetical protein